MHSHDKAKALKQSTEEFIAKRLRQNKPFQSLIATDQYAEFNQAIQDALKAQAKAMSQNMPTLALVQLPGQLEKYVEDNMPRLGKLIDEQAVANYFVFAFEWGVKAQYKRLGLKVKRTSPHFMKVDTYGFTLTNRNYIQSLSDDANYLLNLSSIDDLTRQQIIEIIRQGTLDGMTPDEVSDEIVNQFEDTISEYRADRIARTETAQAMGSGNYAGMIENGVTTKRWVPAGSSTCEICNGNADQGFIPVDQPFDSGDDYEPAHPNCECYTEAGEIDLDSIDIWDGS